MLLRETTEMHALIQNVCSCKRCGGSCSQNLVPRMSVKQVLLQSGGISSAVLDSADFTGQTHHHWQLKSKVQAVSIGFVS